MTATKANDIDGVTLRKDLSAIALNADLDDAARRLQVIDALKHIRATALDNARAALETGADGREVVRYISHRHDLIIQALYDYTTTHVYRSRNPTDAEKISIIAVGGYGRGDLAPYSDIDLLFLLPYKQTPWGESVVEYMLYVLWDLGLKVGHATRTIDQSIQLSKEDLTIRTTLLEMRHLWGDEALFNKLKKRFWADVVEGSEREFIQAKLEESDRRHLRAGASRYLVEPNVKESKGGLRDLQMLFWLAKYVYRVEDEDGLAQTGLFTSEEFVSLLKAYSFLWTVRCRLHFLRDRPEERLSFDVQPQLAEQMSYRNTEGQSAVEIFMKDYFSVAKDIGDLTTILCATLETKYAMRWQNLGRMFGLSGTRKLPHDGFLLEDGRVTVEGPEVFRNDPVNTIRLFHIADKKPADIHPQALRWLKRSLDLVNADLRANADANKLFFELLSSKRDPEWALRRMSEAGVLGRFVLEFGRIEAMMQFNMYHHYTVDEHLIRAMGILSQIERGILEEDHPLANDIIHKVRGREVLYLALFLHDIAKGRPEDHSDAGAQIAYELGPRFGLSNTQTETVAWLVKKHLVMSEYAQSRDLGDPKTIEDFVDIVQSPERLRLLLVLTVADIRAVGPGVWNGWKGQLLRDLYYEAESVLQEGENPGSTRSRSARIAHAKDDLMAALKPWPKKTRRAAVDRHGDAYWLSFDADAHIRHAQAILESEDADEPFCVGAWPYKFQSITELMIFADDQPGWFACLTGALSLSGATIKDAKLFTTHDDKAFDVFYVQDATGAHYDDPQRIKRLKKLLSDIMNGKRDVLKQIARPSLPKREEAFTVDPEVLFDNQASDKHTLIEITARDRPGLLYDLARTLVDRKLSIVSAHISTYGEEAVDVFYVKDQGGHKITKKEALDGIRAALLAALKANADGSLAAE